MRKTPENPLCYIELCYTWIILSFSTLIMICNCYCIYSYRFYSRYDVPPFAMTSMRIVVLRCYLAVSILCAIAILLLVTVSMRLPLLQLAMLNLKEVLLQNLKEVLLQKVKCNLT